MSTEISVPGTMEIGHAYQITFERLFPVRDGEAPAGEGKYVYRGYLGDSTGLHKFTPAGGGPDIYLISGDIKDAH